jgi:hypothetical protein
VHLDLDAKSDEGYIVKGNSDSVDQVSGPARNLKDQVRSSSSGRSQQTATVLKFNSSPKT